MVFVDFEIITVHEILTLIGNGESVQSVSPTLP